MANNLATDQFMKKMDEKNAKKKKIEQSND